SRHRIGATNAAGAQPWIELQCRRGILIGIAVECKIEKQPVEALGTCLCPIGYQLRLVFRQRSRRGGRFRYSKQWRTNNRCCLSVASEKSLDHREKAALVRLNQDMCSLV